MGGGLDSESGFQELLECIDLFTVFFKENTRLCVNQALLIKCHLFDIIGI